MKTLIHKLGAAISGCPETIHGAQNHFAVTLPELREKLRVALTDEFNSHELEVLREELGSILEIEVPHDAGCHVYQLGPCNC